jgi:hypothetical protein
MGQIEMLDKFSRDVYKLNADVRPRLVSLNKHSGLPVHVREFLIVVPIFCIFPQKYLPLNLNCLHSKLTVQLVPKVRMTPRVRDVLRAPAGGSCVLCYTRWDILLLTVCLYDLYM